MGLAGVYRHDKVGFTLYHNNDSVGRSWRGGEKQQRIGDVTVDFARPLSRSEEATLSMSPFNESEYKPRGMINYTTQVYVRI